MNGLSALTSVGSYFYLNNNKLTNVNGLSSLTSVGYDFYLHTNQLTNVDGLSSLTTVGNNFYLHTNQITNIDGLSSLSSVGGNFHVGSNQLTSLRGLENLTTLGGYFAVYNNINLINISSAENIVGKYGKLLYIDLDQYSTKADVNSSLCSTTWDLRDTNGNISDDMSQVCENQEPYMPEPQEKLRDVLEAKCSIANSSFHNAYNADTGHYNGYIYCHSKGLTDEDLLSFKVLKSVSGYLYLSYNNFTNVDGLSNLKSVGREFELYNNQLTNVDGLQKLVSVGREFRLDNNQLTNVNGLNVLTSVGSHFNVEGNQLTNLNGLSSITSLGGNLALRANANLTDISEVSNIQSSNGKLLYINPGQYTTKVDANSSFCSTTWDLRDLSGNIADDMTLVCDMNNIELSDKDKLRNLLGEKCNIDSVTFYNAFNEDTGYYNGSIYCPSKGLTDEELLDFKVLKEVSGYVYLNNNSLTNVDGLSNLKRVGRNFYLNGNQLTNIDGLSSLTSVGDNFNLEENQLTNLDGLNNLISLGGSLSLRDNSNLTDISGVSNVLSGNGQLLYINTAQYTIKANNNASFCSTTWDLRDPSENIADDMTLVCDSQEFYAPSASDKLRDILGEKCNIDSATFYNAFNVDTGYYNGSIYCSSKGLTDEELLDFKVLKEVSGYVYLSHNSLTNVDGLSNLKSVGSLLSLSNNQLTNLDGLSSLTSVKGDFFLQTNQLTNVDGLSSLTTVGNNFNTESNQLTNLDGLINLTILGGYLGLRGNTDLTDISGASNIAGKDGQILYINSNQYEVKANENLKFCSTGWNLHDTNGDIADDMNLVCGAGSELTDVQKLRAMMEEKCTVSFSQFADNFDEDTGVYTGSLDCSYNKLNNDELIHFTLINQITGSLSINDNNLTQIDGLTNLTDIGGYFYLQNNKIEEISGLNGLVSVGGTLDISNNNMLDVDMLSNLTTISGALKIYLNSNLVDIYGLSNIIGIDGKKIYIDNVDYTTKATSDGALCEAQLDIYDVAGNIEDDMSKLCDGYNYVPNNADRLRDLLGKRCAIDSTTFYNNFADDSGIYNGNIKCQSVSDEELIGFAGLFEVHGNFTIKDSDITTLDELIRLKNVTGTLSIQNNTKLIDIDGISNALGVDGQKLIIDDTNQYDIKADNSKDFCATIWNIYDGETHIVNDMSKVCNQ